MRLTAQLCAAALLAAAHAAAHAAIDQATRDRAVAFQIVQKNKACDWLAGAKMLNALLDEDQKALAEYRAEKIPPGMHEDERAVRLIKAMIAGQRARTKKLNDLVDQCGWPTITEYGKAASRAAFLLVQHAEPEVHQRYLETLRALAVTGELAKANYAYLLDRVLLEEGKPQRYGTQVEKLEDGSWTVAGQLEDPDNVDARRRDLEVLPVELCAYLAMMEDGPTTVSYPRCKR